MSNSPKNNSEKNGFFSHFFDDAFRKFSALLLGITCWFFINNFESQSTQRWTTLVDIPIEFAGSENVYIDQEYHPLPVISIKADIAYKHRNRIYNTSDFLIRISEKDLKLDEGNWQTTLPHTTIRLTEDMLYKKPDGLSVHSFIPETIDVYCDKIVTKSVPVKVTHTPPKGRFLEVLTHDLTPTSVNIRGPHHMLNGITELKTEKIEIAGTSATPPWPTRAKIEIPDPLVTVTPDEISLNIELVNSNNIIERSFSDIPVMLLTPQLSDLQVTNSASLPRTVDIILNGTRAILDHMNTQALRAYIDLTDIKSPGTYQVKVGILNLPDNATISYISKAEIQVSCEYVTQRISSMVAAPLGQTTPANDVPATEEHPDSAPAENAE